MIPLQGLSDRVLLLTRLSGDVVAERHAEEGQLSLSVATGRTSKVAFAQRRERATRRIAADVLRALVAAVPYTIHAVLTDSGFPFVDHGLVDEAAEAEAEVVWAAQGEPRIDRAHAFAQAFEQRQIEYRLTEPVIPERIAKARG